MAILYKTEIQLDFTFTYKQHKCYGARKTPNKPILCLQPTTTKRISSKINIIISIYTVKHAYNEVLGASKYTSL